MFKLNMLNRDAKLFGVSSTIKYVLYFVFLNKCLHLSVVLNLYVSEESNDFDNMSTIYSQ